MATFEFTDDALDREVTNSYQSRLEQDNGLSKYFENLGIEDGKDDPDTWNEARQILAQQQTLPAFRGEPGFPEGDLTGLQATKVPEGTEEDALKLMPSVSEALFFAPLGGLRDAFVESAKSLNTMRILLKGGAARLGVAVFDPAFEALGLEPPPEGTPEREQFEKERRARLGVTEEEFDPISVLNLIAEQVPEVREPESLGGQLIRGMAQFMPLFIPAFNKIGKTAQFQRLASRGAGGRLAAEMLRGGAAGTLPDAISFSAEQERLGQPVAKLILEPLEQKFGIPLGSQWVAWLGSPTEIDPGASPFEQSVERVKGSVKNIGEGILIGMALDSVVEGTRFLKAITKAQNFDAKFARAKARTEEFAPMLAGETGAVSPRVAAAFDETDFTIDTVRKTAADIVDSHKKFGGSSFSFTRGNMVDQGRWAVSPFPLRTKTLQRRPNRDDIVRFAARNIDLLEDDRFFVGTWEKKGEHFLDISTEVEKAHAVRLGEGNNQISVTNLKNLDDEVLTGGTGKGPGVMSEEDVLSFMNEIEPRRAKVQPRNLLNDIQDQAEVEAQAFREDLTVRGIASEADFTADRITRLANLGAGHIAAGAQDFDSFWSSMLPDILPEKRVQLTITREIQEEVYKQAQVAFRREARKAIKAQSKEAPEFLRMLDTPMSEQDIVDLRRMFPSTARLRELDLAGQQMRNWYHGATDEIVRIWGRKAAVEFAGVVAALSANAPVDRNISNAVDFFVNWKSGMSFDKASKGLELFSLKSRRNNVKRALGETVNGRVTLDSPKVSRFFRALLGDSEAVTPDRWMKDIFGFGRTIETGGLDENTAQFMESWVRLEARKLGIAAADMQASMWSARKLEVGLRPGEVLEPVRDTIKRNLDRLVAEGKLEFPPGMDQAGKIEFGTIWLLSRTIAGAAAGSFTGDTTEERVRNALIGAGVAAAGPKLISALTKEADTLANATKRAKAPIGTPKAYKNALNIETSTLQDIAARWTRLREEFGSGVRVTREASRERAKELLARGDVSVDKLKEMLPGEGFANEAETFATVELLVHEGEKLIGLARAAAANPDDREAVQRAVKQIALFAQIDPRRLGAISTTGRQLGILNDPTSTMNAFLRQFEQVFNAPRGGKTAQQIMEQISSYTTLHQMSHFSKQLTKPGFLEIVSEVWINGLLWGPKTHMANFLSNVTFALWSIPERGVAGIIGRNRAGAVKAGEMNELVYGYFTSLADAFNVAHKAFKEDMPQFGGQGKLEARTKRLSSEALMLTGSAGQAVDAIGEFVRLSGRFLLAGDEFFKAIAYRGEVRAHAFREAYDRVVNGIGLEGPRATAEMRKIMNEIIADPPPDIKEAAQQFAHYQTFTNELGPKARKFQELARESPMARFVLPFVRTPVNLAKRGVERTPAGFLGQRPKRLADRNMKNARAALGSMSMAMFGMMAAAGGITGTGPANRKTRAEWIEQGWQPLSFRLPLPNGEWGPWISYARVEPLASVFGLAADMTDILGAIGRDDLDAEDRAFAFATQTMVSLKNLFFSKTFLRGAAQFVHIFMEPDKFLEFETRQFAATFVPFAGAMRQLATAYDPRLKEIKRTSDSIKASIPGLSKDVPGRTNLFGEEIILGSGFNGAFGFFFDLVSPVTIKASRDETTRKLYTEMLRIQNETGESLSTSVPRTVNGVKLLPEEVGQMGQLMGQVRLGGFTLKQAMADELRQPEWKQLGPREQYMIIQHMINQYKKAAGDELRFRNPALEQAIFDRQIEQEEQLQPRDLG